MLYLNLTKAYLFILYYFEAHLIKFWMNLSYVYYIKLDLMFLISYLVFPATATMYLLIIIEGKLENLSSNIYELDNNI